MPSSWQDEKKTVAPKRAYKPNPLLQTRDATTQQRRDMFFKRVQKDRDDQKWHARSEQIQRIVYVSDHKRWEAKKAQEAPELEDRVEDFLQEEATLANNAETTLELQQNASEVDYIMAQEEHELQALIASLDREQEQDAMSQHYGSNDEDYDQLFMDFTSSTEAQSSQQPAVARAGVEDKDAMDMS